MSGECEECSQKTRLGLQTKLKINEPGDIYEQEADRIADQVMATPAHPAVSGAPLRIQRFVGQPTGQMDEAPASVDQALSSPGRSLEPTLRQDMEQRFGYDFSQVRVHTSTAAEQSARDVNAQAYTVGRDIIFAAGQYTPGSEIGRRLLAHELVHTMQQKGGAVRVQRYTAGGCAAKGETVDEQKDEASRAGIIAHRQIQAYFYPRLDLEASIPRATKDNRDPSCPPLGRKKGDVDLWQYDGAGHAQIGEIKSIHGRDYAAPDVFHYIRRFYQLVIPIRNL